MLKPLPKHLKRFTIKQDYSRYTPEDQAVWRYTMRRLRQYLSVHAHECYLEGLKKTGLDSESIPKVQQIDKKLRRFGWGAVPVSGFIPPAAFMEFQALGYLPIATEIRTADHIDYTPAPDIVHEAAGHAPIIVDKEYAAYLRQYAQIAAKSIISKEDIEHYEAIRLLSDAKEDSRSTPAEIEKLEANLSKTSKAMTEISEAGLLGRMNWWTAEYGLVGDLQNPKIFGAGLLSSPGEAKTSLAANVEKIPFSIDCIEYSYDITERQPQLFVTPSFKHLGKVLTELQKTMSFERGGTYGLDKAIGAKTVNTVVLDSGLQISGQVERYERQGDDTVTFIKFKGPCQLSVKGKQLKGHGPRFHQHGFSSPLGPVKGEVANLVSATAKQLRNMGLKKNQTSELHFASGIKLSGNFHSVTRSKGKNILLTFKKCTVTDREKVLFAPEWGVFDMALGHQITSVFGGPADRVHYGSAEEFVAQVIPPRKRSARENRLYKIYSEVRALRNFNRKNKKSQQAVHSIWLRFQSEFFDQWLLGLEIFELMALHKMPSSELQDTLSHLLGLPISSQSRMSLHEGLSVLKASGILPADFKHPSFY